MDGMSGAYLGKDWASLEVMFRIFSVEEQALTLQFMKVIEVVTVDHTNEKISQKA